MIHYPTSVNFLRITSNMLCIVASIPYGIWTCFRWGNSWSPGASLPRPGSGSQLSSPRTLSQWRGVPEVDAGIYDVPEVLNWIQDCINAFIIQELLTHSSHRRAAAGRPHAHWTGVWWVCYPENLCGLQMLPRPVASLENAMLAMKGWNHSLVGVVSLLHLWTVPLEKQHVHLMHYCFLSGQADLDLHWHDSVLPLLFCAATTTTDTLNLLVMKLLLVFFVLVLTALLLRNRTILGCCGATSS